MAHTIRCAHDDCPEYQSGEFVTTEATRQRLADRIAHPATVQERMQAVHADAYTSWPDGDPICATCHNGNCPRYWRIQQRLDQQEAKRRASLPPAVYEEEPPW